MDRRNQRLHYFASSRAQARHDLRMTLLFVAILGGMFALLVAYNVGRWQGQADHARGISTYDHAQTRILE